MLTLRQHRVESPLPQGRGHAAAARSLRRGEAPRYHGTAGGKVGARPLPAGRLGKVAGEAEDA